MLTLFSFCTFSDIDLLKHLLKHNSSRGIHIDSKSSVKLTQKWKPQIFQRKNYRKFWKNYHGQLSFFISGHIKPEHETVPFFAIFHRKKTLPYLELSINIKKRKLVIRYQGKISFQRKSIEIGINPVIQYSSIFFSINRTKLELSFDCDTHLQLQLRQPLAWIPPSSKISLSDPKASHKFAVSK